MKKRNVLVAIMLSALVIGCGKEDAGTNNPQSSQKETVTEESTAKTEENTEKTETPKEDTTKEDTTEVPEDAKTEVDEKVEYEDSGIITRLIVVANDPNASSFSDDGATYFFTNDDNGKRELGGVSAYYTDLPSNIDTSSQEAFCRSFIENVVTELTPYCDDAVAELQDDFYVYAMQTERCTVALMPDNDYSGIMVFVTDITDEAYEDALANEGINADFVGYTLDDVYNWYVGDIWNPITCFRDYITTGKDSSGNTFDAEFAYETFKKAWSKKDDYTAYIHEVHPDATLAWDKMMEQVEKINANLADGFATGSEKIDTDLLSQYSESFYEYYWDYE